MQPERIERAKDVDVVRIGLVVVALLTLLHVGAGLVAPARIHFVATDTVALTTSVGWAARLVLASAAALALVVGPGLTLRPRVRSHPLLGNAAFLWVPGALALATTGLAAWLLEPLVSPRAVSAMVLTVVSVWILWSVRIRDRGPTIDSGEKLALVLLLLLLAIGVGRAAWSPGPEGELYGGSISRTLEVGPRSDSRISYNAVQLVANGDSPYGVIGAAYYAPYNFFARADRGPGSCARRPGRPGHSSTGDAARPGVGTLRRAGLRDLPDRDDAAQRDRCSRCVRAPHDLS